MLIRERLTTSVAAMAVAMCGLASACSSSNPRDINYGTDVAANFVPPDASVTVDGDAMVEESGKSADGGGGGGGEVAIDRQDEEVGMVDSMVDSTLDVDAAIGGAN
jgi:hypothetical protein